MYLCVAGFAQATVYTWTNTVDGNWSNTANWASGTLPVDTAAGSGSSAGLSVPYTDEIVFDATNLPTVNFPGIGGYVGHDSPTMRFNSGGAAIFHIADRTDQYQAFWTNTETNRTVLTVGDGVGGGTEDVDLTISGLGTVGSLARHDSNITNNYLVNSDGSLTFADSHVVFATYATRYATITIAGGDVTFDGTVAGLDDFDDCYVEFTTPGGSFTAAKGGDMPSVAYVTGRLGVDFLNNTGEGSNLRVVDNGDGTLTVSEGLRWTGTAGDGDWSNSVNWVGGRIPQDTLLDGSTANPSYDAGLSLSYANIVEFAGTNMPSMNIPGIGGTVGHDTPTMNFNRGGTIDLELAGREKDFWSNSGTRTVWTVGDGIGEGVEDVVVNLTMNDDLSRHADGHNTFVVNSDGTFNIMPSLAELSFANTTNRTSQFTIDGGTVVVDKPVRNLTSAGYEACVVEFTAMGGSFTAQYGHDFGDIGDVESSLGVDFVDNTGVDGAYVRATDNGSTFTVTVHKNQGMVMVVR